MGRGHGPVGAVPTDSEVGLCVLQHRTSLVTAAETNSGAVRRHEANGSGVSLSTDGQEAAGREGIGTPRPSPPLAVGCALQMPLPPLSHGLREGERAGATHLPLGDPRTRDVIFTPARSRQNEMKLIPKNNIRALLGRKKECCAFRKTKLLCVLLQK